MIDLHISKTSLKNSKKGQKLNLIPAINGDSQMSNLNQRPFWILSKLVLKTPLILPAQWPRPYSRSIKVNTQLLN